MNDPTPTPERQLTYRFFERTSARTGRSRRRFYQHQLTLGFAPVRQRWAERLEAAGVEIELLRPIIPEGATKHSHKKMVLVPVRCAEVIYKYNDARAKAPGAEPGFAGLTEDTIARLAAEAWRATLPVPGNIAGMTLTTMSISVTIPIKLSQIVDTLGGTDALVSLLKKGGKAP